MTVIDLTSSLLYAAREAAELGINVYVYQRQGKANEYYILTHSEKMALQGMRVYFNKTLLDPMSYCVYPNGTCGWFKLR